MKKTSNFIWVTLSREGVHRYPAALTDPALSEVKFLGYDHRHVFHIRADLEIFHEDREVEFILFKRWLESLFVDSTLQLDYKSCEMIADDLAEKIHDKYPNRKIKISVSEDGENGSYSEYE